MSVLNVDKIFVLHYTKLEERKKTLDEYLNLNNIDVEYILDFDQEELTKEIIDEWYNADPIKYHETIDQCYKERSAPYREGIDSENNTRRPPLFGCLREEATRALQKEWFA